MKYRFLSAQHLEKESPAFHTIVVPVVPASMSPKLGPTLLFFYTEMQNWHKIVLHCIVYILLGSFAWWNSWWAFHRLQLRAVAEQHPWAKRYGNNAQGLHTVAPSSVGDRNTMMIDDKTAWNPPYSFRDVQGLSVEPAYYTGYRVQPISI